MKSMITVCLAALISSQAFFSYGQEPAEIRAEAMVGKKSGLAQESPERSKKPPPGSAADANNPLAAIKSVSVHNIYTTAMYGTDATANVVWKRYAQPIGRFLLRASLPVNTLATPGSSVSGLGDFNVFLTWVATRPTAKFQFGFGPVITCPTATDKVLGSGKWSAGLALIGYFGSNPHYQVGFLATWQHSFAGNKERKAMHAASIQPMFMWQLGKGLYMRSTGIIVLDFPNDNYFIPFGLGMGKVFNTGKLTFNLFFEPQFTTWHHGSGIPKIQLFCGINTQF